MPTLKQAVVSPVDPWALQKRISASDARYAQASGLMPASDTSYIRYISGVLASGDGGNTHMAAKVKPAGLMTVTVEPANVIIDTANSGPYQGLIYERTTLTLDPASTTTNRMDVVLVRIHDDKNPAIGSPAEERKLTVELWTGDEMTGDPTPPVIPVAAGWHPLAYIKVMANDTSISASAITDKRGPGIVTRGGIRPFYGDDAAQTSPLYVAPGAYPGEQRWAHTAGFPHQIWFGANSDPARSGWHGVQNMQVFNANSTLGTTWHMGSKIYRTLCSITVPYPGVPYMVEPMARVATRMSPGVSLDMRITVDAYNGPAINWESYQTPQEKSGNVDGTGDYRHTFNVAPLVYGPFTTSKTFFLSAHTYDNWGTNWQVKGWRHWEADMRQNLLQVKVIPSTLQPPNNLPNDGSGDDIADKNS